MERGFVSASMALPADIPREGRISCSGFAAAKCTMVRWTIKQTSRGGTCCHEVDIDDGPDYLHHWYDHFYCERPCAHG